MTLPYSKQWPFPEATTFTVCAPQVPPDLGRFLRAVLTQHAPKLALLIDAAAHELLGSSAWVNKSLRQDRLAVLRHFEVRNRTEQEPLFGACFRRTELPFA